MTGEDNVTDGGSAGDGGTGSGAGSGGAGSGGAAAGTPTWVWWALGAGGVVLVIVVFAIAARSTDDGTTEALPTTSTTEAETTTTVAETTTTVAETTTTVAETTTTVAETTTTVAETTTTVAETTTTATPPPTFEVAPTSVTATLGEPADNIYGNGADLFTPGSVQAAWYQWDGFYVLLYRGFNLADAGPVCPGNSQFIDGFSQISNSPAPVGADAACDGSPNVVNPPLGAQECGDLLYYVTIIPVDANATGAILYGSMERSAGGGAFDGQTSQATADAANTPEFQPGLTAYSLPASSVDDAQMVTCG